LGFWGTYKKKEDKDKADKIGGVRKAMLIHGVRNVLHISPCKISLSIHRLRQRPYQRQKRKSQE